MKGINGILISSVLFATLPVDGAIAMPATPGCCELTIVRGTCQSGNSPTGLFCSGPITKSCASSGTTEEARLGGNPANTWGMGSVSCGANNGTPQIIDPCQISAATGGNGPQVGYDCKMVGMLSFQSGAVCKVDSTGRYSCQPGTPKPKSAPQTYEDLKAN